MIPYMPEAASGSFLPSPIHHDPALQLNYSIERFFNDLLMAVGTIVTQYCNHYACSHEEVPPLLEEGVREERKLSTTSFQLEQLKYKETMPG